MSFAPPPALTAPPSAASGVSWNVLPIMVTLLFPISTAPALAVAEFSTNKLSVIDAVPETTKAPPLAVGVVFGGRRCSSTVIVPPRSASPLPPAVLFTKVLLVTECRDSLPAREIAAPSGADADSPRCIALKRTCY